MGACQSGNKTETTTKTTTKTTTRITTRITTITAPKITRCVSNSSAQRKTSPDGQEIKNCIGSSEAAVKLLPELLEMVSEYAMPDKTIANDTALLYYPYYTSVWLL